tara:strand:+ start:65 stop:433 length:369 start_codon:yes stop_codon:yes gene_type:complete
MSEEKDEKDEYELASDYAERHNKPVEDVITSIGQGTLEGCVIDGKWHVESEARRDERGQKRMEAESKRIKGQEKADRDQGLVKVTRIRIPFGDMVVLYLQVAGAALIVFGIPALIFALIAAS